MAEAGKLPFGVIVSTLFILHCTAVSSERDCRQDEYSTECEETNATLLSTCEAKLSEKEAQVARTEAELVRIQSQLAESRTELARTTAELTTSRTKLSQKESELVLMRDQLAQKEFELVDKSAELAQTRDQLAQSRTKPAQQESEQTEKVAEWAENHTHLAETSWKPLGPEADRQRLPAEFNGSQIHLRSILKELAENNATLTELMGIQYKVLSTALLSMNMTTIPATVPIPKIYETLNKAAKFSCESVGRPLSLCLWSRMVGGQQEVIWTNRRGGNVSTDGIQLSSPADLDGGRCSAIIEAVMEDHFGAWTCILVTAADGEALTGDVELRDATDASIFFPKFMDGIWRFSVKTSQLTRMWNSDEYIVGIAFDAARNITYWTSGYTIYRATINQTETETLLNSTADRKYGSFNGLAYDWIADNLYVATHRFVLSCNYDATFRCVTLVSGQGLLNGIALDPNEGTMYISRFTGDTDEHCIFKAGTDGSSPTGIVAGAQAAHGIQIDFQSRRLYWAEWFDSRIRSSNLDGGEVLTVNGNSRPFGISLVGSRIFWSDYLGELRSMLKSGREILNVRETSGMYIPAHIAATDWNLPKNRPNHCASQDCSGLCVLTRTSFKCLE